MRARGTLVMVCALFGATALMPPAEAADRSDSRVQRQGDAARAERQAPRRVAARVMPGAPLPMLMAMPTSAGAAGPMRVAMPAVARGVGSGTPILPVAATSGLSCVPFARMATGLQITGDARLWWHRAAGTYARGQLPERGSVLAFAASGGMQRGHVAVVSRVLDARTILIDHSNWAGPGIRRGTVMRGVKVIDVSDRNDWTAVRVQVGWNPDTFGRTYPTHGFIYNRPEGDGTVSAGLRAMPEVAEAPSPHLAQHLRLTAQLFPN